MSLFPNLRYKESVLSRVEIVEDVIETLNTNIATISLTAGPRGEAFKIDAYGPLTTQFVSNLQTTKVDGDNVRISSTNFYYYLVTRDNRMGTPLLGIPNSDLSRHVIMYNGTSWNDFGPFTGLSQDIPDSLQALVTPPNASTLAIKSALKVSNLSDTTSILLDSLSEPTLTLNGSNASTVLTNSTLSLLNASNTLTVESTGIRSTGPLNISTAVGETISIGTSSDVNTTTALNGITSISKLNIGNIALTGTPPFQYLPNNKFSTLFGVTDTGWIVNEAVPNNSNWVFCGSNNIITPGSYFVNWHIFKGSVTTKFRMRVLGTSVPQIAGTTLTGSIFGNAGLIFTNTMPDYGDISGMGFFQAVPEYPHLWLTIENNSTSNAVYVVRMTIVRVA